MAISVSSLLKLKQNSLLPPPDRQISDVRHVGKQQQSTLPLLQGVAFANEKQSEQNSTTPYVDQDAEVILWVKIHGTDSG